MFCRNNVTGFDERDARTSERFLAWRYASCARERGGCLPLRPSHTSVQADELQRIAEGFLAETCR